MNDLTHLRPPKPAAAARLSRRAFLTGLTGTALAAAAAGCAAPASPTTTRPSGTISAGRDQVQLVYQDWRTDWFPPMVQQQLEIFHAAHPNIRVYYVPDPENAHFQEKMLADFEAGTAADVFQGCCTHFPIWAQSGYTLDLRPFVAADIDAATIADWDPAQYQAFFARDGKQFGLPKYHGALALYYNKDLLQQAKVTFPDETWTHDDYLEAMRKLTHTRISRYRGDQWGSMMELSWERMQVRVNAWGGHLVDPKDPTRSLMAEAPSLAAFQWQRDRFWSDKVMPTGPDVQNVGTREAFVAGRVAMVEDGSWALKDILTQADFPVGVAPMPAGPARRATLATTDGFGIYAHTRHPDAAWELVKFLIGQEYGRAMARANFLQPARASLVDQWASYVRQEYPAKAADIDLTAFAHGHLNGYSVTAEVFSNQAAAQQIAYTAWDQVLTFGEAQVDRIAEASAQIDAIQHQGRSVPWGYAGDCALGSLDGPLCPQSSS